MPKSIQSISFIMKSVVLCTFLFATQLSMATPGTREISGKIVDEKNSPLAGVSVTIKGGSGTTTNSNGEFVLSVPDGKIALVISMVGYVSQEVAVENLSRVLITLRAEAKSMDAVVVTGYTSQSRRTITGAVSVVDVKELTKVPNASFEQQLQGRVAGVTVTTDAAPGGETLVRIRGIGSVTGSSSPLYIIDGVPAENGLRQLNPADIESMQVLKDAASASIYGSRASNGVVIITTKKGRGKPQVSFEAYVSSQQPQYDRFPKFVDPLTQANIYWQAYKNTNGGATPSDVVFGSGPQPEWTADYMVDPTGNIRLVKEGDPLADPSHYSIDPSDPEWGKTKYIIVKLNKQGTNWYKETFKPALLQSYNLTVSGSSDKSRFALSTGYFDQQGIMINTFFKRYSIRANSEFNIADHIRVGENMQFSYTLENLPDRNSGVFGTVGRIFYTNPIAPVYDIGGNFTGTPNSYYWYHNPVAEQYYNKDNDVKNSLVFGNVYAEADLLKGLTARTSFGLGYGTGVSSTFSQKIIQELEASGDASLTVNNNTALNWTWTNTLNYTKTFSKVHQLSAIVGTEAISNSYRYNGSSKRGFASNDLSYRYLDAGLQITNSYGSGSDSKLFSYFGKVDYAYNDKYLLSATLRRDASSRFSEANRWGTFPAFSVGWRLSRENFMQNIKFINDLKLRGSWGKTGNQNIGDYNQYSTYGGNPASTGYDISGTGNSMTVGYTRTLVGNPNAQWEAQTMTNVGLDATILDNRIGFSIDLYDRRSDQLLLNVPHPAVEGQKTFPAENVGSVQNKGIDLQLSYNNRAAENKFNYGITLNWSTVNNKITALYGGNDAFLEGVHLNGNGYDFGSATRSVVGQPISSFYGLVKLGTFQTDAEAKRAPAQFGNPDLYNKPGRWYFKDVDGDQVIDITKDMTFIGNPTPKFTYGANLTAAYKGFDASVFFQGVYGNKIFNSMKFWTDFVPNSISYAASTKALDSWTPQNPNALMPELNINAANGFETLPSTFYVEDGSYLRLKNVQIGYTLPQSALRRMHINRLRVYVSGTNLFTITKYTGIDPEITYTKGSLLSLGVDQGIYPFSKTYTLGVQLGF